MAIYSIKLKHKKEEAFDTMSFHFDRPEGLEFKAGQFADYTLINPEETDAEGDIRGFSFCNAPYEDDMFFTTRMRDTAFKRSLRKMEIGTEITMDAAYGSFTLQNNTKVPAVFLCGGIGITPVRSIILQATHDKTAHKLFLFYSNNTPADAVFLNDFKEGQKQNKNFTFVPTMTNIEQLKDWKGQTGFFNQDLLSKYISDLSLPIFYVSGPANMVTSIRKTLNESGVDNDNIRTEEFSGY